MFIPHWVVLLFWLIIHLAIEMYQFKQSKSEEGIIAYFDVWNVFDLARLGSQAI
jgi:hypothetical protein